MAQPAQTKEQKLALINDNLAEVLNPEIIEKVLDEGRNVKVYWGMCQLQREDLRHCFGHLTD